MRFSEPVEALSGRRRPWAEIYGRKKKMAQRTSSHLPLVALQIASEVDPRCHADVGMAQLIGDPGDGHVGLVEECRDGSSKCMRHCPGELGCVEGRTHGVCAVALSPHLLRIVQVCRRCKDVAAVSVDLGASGKAGDEPVGEVEPTFRGFALGAAHVHAAPPEVDLVPAEAAGLIDTDARPGQERHEIGSRPALPTSPGIETWLLRCVVGRLDYAIAFSPGHRSRVVTTDGSGRGRGDGPNLAHGVAGQHSVVNGIREHSVEDALGLLGRGRSVRLGDALQEAAEALRIIGLLESEAAQRRGWGIDVGPQVQV